MHSKKILLTVNILLTTLILWLVSDMVMNRSSGQGGPGTLQGEGPKEDGKAQKPLGKTKSIADYQALIQQDVFRTTRQKSEPEPEAKPAPVVEEKPVEMTKLNLKLKGVVIRGGNGSFAAIMDGGTKKEGIYYLNDTIQSARIAKILYDQVILEVNNRQEALLLFTQSDKSEKAGVARQAVTNQARQSVVASGHAPDPTQSALGAAKASRLPAMIRQRRR